MIYQQITSNFNAPYPDHSIDPKLKKADFCMQYARAAYFDWSWVYPKGLFANNGGDYEKFKLYALEKQPNSQYKKMMGVNQQTNQTWLTVDWSIRSAVAMYRDRAISRLMKQTTEIVATPIDILAKAEMDEYYADVKAKLLVRDLLKQANSEVASHPMITLMPGEPMDIEELEMRVNLGEQFNRSKDAEQAVSLGFYENNYENFRRGLYEDLFDLGVAGYKEWLGEDNHAKFRRVNPECIVTNFCRKGDFSDLVHAGEVIDVSLIDLALVKDEDGNRKFSDAELQEFAGSLAGKYGNPSILGTGLGWIKPFDKFKCKVMDLTFFSYDDYNYRSAPDKEGNIDFRKADYNRGKNAAEKYTRKCIKAVYKVKWIVGTEHCYDWGLMYDQKRSVEPKKKAETTLPFKFFAYNFYEMMAQGIMQRVIPEIDDYQLTKLKVQNWKNRAVPSGWWIDLDSLENAALNKGGKNMTSEELLQMFFDNGILVGRSKDHQGVPMGPNWKPVIPIQNSILSELVGLYQDMELIINRIEKITGYNPVTSGESNPKMLVPGYETAEISTDDALYPLAFAESQLTKALAEDVLCRMKQGVRKGKVEGAMPYKGALNSNTLTFISLDSNLALRDHGIMLQEKSTDNQKMWLLQQMQQDIANGFLDSSDAAILINTHNVKQAWMIWAYRVKKAKEQVQQNEMAKIQENNKGSAEAAQVASQLKIQEMQIEAQLKLQHMVTEEGEKRKTEAMKLHVEAEIAQRKNVTIIQQQALANEGKVETQEVANEKPVSSPSK